MPSGAPERPCFPLYTCLDMRWDPVLNARPMSGGMNSIFSVRATAKVNLYLEILGRRPDGYHDIRSVVMPVSLFDEISLESTDGLVETVLVKGKGQVAGEKDLDALTSADNLTTQVANDLKERTGYPGGVRIHLKKGIPVGGGLGGGSADAAAVLVALNEFWRTGLSRETLMEIGSRRGSDVPALVYGGMVVMEGRGERVTRLPGNGNRSNGHGGWWLVLVNPGFSVSTRDIYSRYRSPLTSGAIPFTSLVSAIHEGNLNLVAQGLFNGLQDTVFTKYPLIEMVAEGLRKGGAIGVLVSGSGASVFGLAWDEEHARSIEERVQKELGFSVWSKVVKTLPDSVTVAHGPLEARV